MIKDNRECIKKGLLKRTQKMFNKKTVTKETDDV